jgi:predicted Zn-dependent protease
MSKNKKSSDAQIIELRNAAWNNRPIRSMEMFAKTSKERKELANAKKENKRVLSTYGGRYELRGIQRKLMNTQFPCKVSFTKVVL